MKKDNSLFVLNRFLDSKGIICINSRLSQSQGLTYNKRFAQPLPYSTHLTRLLLHNVHTCTMHGDVSLMRRIVRSEFSISRLKILVKLEN